MPLLPGKKNIPANISELTHHGSRPRSHEQIVAIAMSNARRHPRADGGSTTIDTALRLARGGSLQGYEKPAGQSSPYGFSVGTGLGRNDKNEIGVAPQSYVLPADVMAGLGDGNSLAGAHVWELMLNSMPWGVARPKPAGQRSLPSAPQDASLMQGITGTYKQPALARGGSGHNGGPPLEDEVPIIAADGEWILSPEDVLRVGQHYASQRELDNYPASHDRIMRRAHAVLDNFVKQTRGKTIKHLRGLKGPVGSSEPSKGHI